MYLDFFRKKSKNVGKETNKEENPLIIDMQFFFGLQNSHPKNFKLFYQEFE